MNYNDGNFNQDLPGDLGGSSPTVVGEAIGMHVTRELTFQEVELFVQTFNLLASSWAGLLKAASRAFTAVCLVSLVSGQAHAAANSQLPQRACPVEWLLYAQQAYQEVQFAYRVYHREMDPDFLSNLKMYGKIFFSKGVIPQDLDKKLKERDISMLFYPPYQLWLNVYSLPDLSPNLESLAADSRVQLHQAAAALRAEPDRVLVDGLPRVFPVLGETSVPEADILTYLDYLDRVAHLEFRYGPVRATLAQWIRDLDVEAFRYRLGCKEGTYYDKDCNPQAALKEHKQNSAQIAAQIRLLRPILLTLKRVESKTAKLKEWLRVAAGDGQKACQSAPMPQNHPAVQPQIVYIDDQYGSLTIHFRLANVGQRLSAELLQAWKLEVNNGLRILPERKEPLIIRELGTGKRVTDPVAENAFVLMLPDAIYRDEDEYFGQFGADKVVIPGSVRFVPKPGVKPELNLQASAAMEVVAPEREPDRQLLDKGT